METKKRDIRKWIQLGLVSALVVAVIILAAVTLKMQHRLEALTRVPARGDLASSAAVTPPADKPDKSPPDMDDDWFSNPFDPGKWDPFTEMQRMQKHIDHMFDDSFGRFGQSLKYRDLVREPDFSPKVDVREDKDRFVMKLDLPGVDKGSVDVQVNGRNVEISGERNDIVTQTDKDGHTVRQERRTGKFSRTVELPEPVDASKMTAKDDNGVFTIVLPKSSNRASS
jgi:HSP20 family protein